MTSNLLPTPAGWSRDEKRDAITPGKAHARPKA
jgi:hypothetical protein